MSDDQWEGLDLTCEKCDMGVETNGPLLRCGCGKFANKDWMPRLNLSKKSKAWYRKSRAYWKRRARMAERVIKAIKAELDKPRGLNRLDKAEFLIAQIADLSANYYDKSS